MSNIVWEEPAPIEKRLSKNQQILKALKENPGQWGRVLTAKNHQAAYQQAMKIRGAARQDGGYFEFTARKLRNNQGAVYGRFLSEEPADNQFRDQGFTLTTK